MKESLKENPSLPRNARSHYENILSKMGYKKWDHRKRQEQLERAINNLKREENFREKFDSILPPSKETEKKRQGFEKKLQRKIQEKFEENKRKILNTLRDDTKLKKWWMKLLGWTEPSNTAADLGTTTAADQEFKKKLGELARYTRFLNGLVTAPDQNKKLYDYAMKKAIDLLSKYHFIIINQVNK